MSGGSSDTDVKELAVMPCTRPGALSTVTTVTPVANWPRARRKSSEVSGTDDMGFSEDITGEEQTGEARFECGRTLKVKRSGDKSRSFLWTDSFHVSVKVDGPYFPYFPSLAAAAWHSLAAAWAAVVVFELLFVRSAAVFAVVVVFGFAAAGVARSLFVAPFFAAVAVAAAGAASLAAAALLADRP